MNLDDYRWLVGPEAAPWLDLVAGQPAEAVAGLVSLTERLRQELSAERTHLVLQQSQLRQKAREKFIHAERMFFTPVGLEQASDQVVAAYKASRFPDGKPLADLCCGIGGDLLSLVGRGATQAIDRDPAVLVLAEANLLAQGKIAAQLRAADVEDISLADVAAWHIDPDRRPAGRRTTRAELHEPGPAAIARLLADCPHAAVKLSPAATLTEDWWRDAHWEWISRGRECKQLVAWFGDLAEQPGRRSATVLGRAKAPDAPNCEVVARFTGEPELHTPVAERIGRYVLEPDAAVLAAKLEGALAAEQSLTVLAPGVAYYTSDVPVASGALECFEVIEVMPYRAATLGRWLAERGIGRLEIKKRGIELAPDDVRCELLAVAKKRAVGDGEAIILLAKIAGRVTAIVAKRVARSTAMATSASAAHRSNYRLASLAKSVSVSWE